MVLKSSGGTPVSTLHRDPSGVSEETVVPAVRPHRFRIECFSGARLQSLGMNRSTYESVRRDPLQGSLKEGERFCDECISSAIMHPQSDGELKGNRGRDGN